MTPTGAGPGFVFDIQKVYTTVHCATLLTVYTDTDMIPTKRSVLFRSRVKPTTFEQNESRAGGRSVGLLCSVKYLKRNETKIVCIYFHFTERQLHILMRTERVAGTKGVLPLLARSLFLNGPK